MPESQKQHTSESLPSSHIPEPSETENSLDLELPVTKDSLQIRLKLGHLFRCLVEMS